MISSKKKKRVKTLPIKVVMRWLRDSKMTTIKMKKSRKQVIIILLLKMIQSLQQSNITSKIKKPTKIIRV